MAESPTICPLCNQGNAVFKRFAAFHPTNPRPARLEGAYGIKCSTCGEFALAIRDADMFAHPEIPAYEESHMHVKAVRASLARIRALLLESELCGYPRMWLQLLERDYWPHWHDLESLEDYEFVPVKLAELLTRWPSTIGARLDRILANLVRKSNYAGDWIRLDTTRSDAMFFASNPTEKQFFLDALTNAGLISKSQRGGAECVTVLPSGWNHIADIEGKGKSSRRNPVFVAMSYGINDTEENPAFMSDLFVKAIDPAIKDAGYVSQRVDLEQHNDFIVDKIISMIRSAPFVVADYTCNRNGVYFEAGFARGFGLPVIHTCRKSHFDRAHFDIKQINTIKWETPDELREQLALRITATLGQGPYPVPKAS